MNKPVFIISAANASSIIGFVQNAAIAAEKAGENIVVSSAADLEASFSNKQMTDLFNAITGEERSQFKTSKAESSVKVFEALQNLDISKLIQLDKDEQATVQTAAADQPKVRKVRDSKLQRMAAAFREKAGDKHREWTIKQLMETCGTPEDPISERIACVYISILRSPTDRFKMNIIKNKETNTYSYVPAEEPAASTTEAAPQAAVQ